MSSHLRFAWRTISRNRSFTLATSGLLAAGIGVTTLMFSAVDAIVLRPLPVKHPEQLVHFVQHVPRQGTVSSVPMPVYEALRDRLTSFSAVLGERLEVITMTEPAPAERIRIHLSTPSFFEDLGVRAELGRTLIPGDAKDNSGDPPAVLSYGFWQRRFNGDPQALGKTIRVQGHTFVIVGVLPREFNGLAADSGPDVRLPLRVWPLLAPGLAGRPEYVSLELAGRLKPGVSITRAQAEARTIWDAAFADMRRRMPGNVSRGPVYPLDLDPLEDGTSVLRDRYGAALKFLVACSGLLLLMVCANVAGLLLAEGAVRRQEFAVRLAMGATRARLVSQMLVESSFVGALGAAGGIMLAAVLTPLLSHMLPVIHDGGNSLLTLSPNIGIDRRVLMFSLALSTATVLLFGLAPAITGSRTSLESILRANRSRRTWRGRKVLLLIQVAMCTALLSGATLLIRTLQDLRKLNPGFDSEHVVTFTIEIPIFYQPGMAIESLQQRAVSFFDTLQERIQEAPGVASVSLAERGIMRERGMGTTIARVGERPSQEDFLAVSVNDVTPSYFETLGLRLLSGGLFHGSPYNQPKPEQVIVNEAFVQRFFPGVDPVGRRFGRAAPGQLAGPDAEIIGVVSDAKYRSLREPIRPTLYEPFPYGEGTLVVHVRTRGKPELMIQPVRHVIQEFDASMPIINIDTLADEVEASSSSERLTAALGSLFAILAVVLSAAGIYGLLAYAVAQRRREIGIRVALGATPSDVRGLIGREGLTLVIGGIILGVIVARVASPLIASLLYGVSPADGSSLAGAALGMLALSIIAAAVPMGQAAYIDPASALRDDH